MLGADFRFASDMFLGSYVFPCCPPLTVNKTFKNVRSSQQRIIRYLGPYLHINGRVI